MTTTPTTTTWPAGLAGPPRQRDKSGLLSLAAVVVGAVLMTIASINQPFNQNELQQMRPYASDDLAEITSGTRQPPLDPLLGGAVQHVLGEGQLQQRLVPLLAGIGTLMLLAALFRRLRFGYPGAVAVWITATAPLMVRYTAYTRPYALPLFLMLAFAYAGQRWLETRRLAWLLTAAVPAALLPLARVPEPMAFLGGCVVALGLLGCRRRMPWTAAGPLIGVALAALVFVGYPQFRSLQSQTSGEGQVFDPNPTRVLGRLDDGADEIVTGLLPLLADWIPWWPITLTLVVVAISSGLARRRLANAWAWWPLLLAPIVFVLAYHFLNPFPFDVRPYRARMAYFFVPALAFVCAAVGAIITESRSLALSSKVMVGGLLAAVFLGQLPTTIWVLTSNDAIDYGQAGEVLSTELPGDAIVLYDSPAQPGMWRQPFSGRERYLDDAPTVLEVTTIAQSSSTVPVSGPVYLLLLDSECASSVVCDMPRQTWRGEVEGFEVFRQFDRFTLYAPAAGQSGRAGVQTALTALADAYGPTLGTVNVYAAAELLRADGHARQGRALVSHLYASFDEEARQRYYDIAVQQRIYPFPTAPG